MAEWPSLQQLGQTWPARMAKSALQALALPGDVYQGNVPMTGEDGRTSLEAIGKSADLAGLVMGGSYASPAMQDVAGMGIRGYHGSPMKDLTSISANPTARQFDNATSQLGAYFAPKEAGAQRYAGKNGKVYEAEVPIEKPYEMPWGEFNALQSPHKGPDGKSLDGSLWSARFEELKVEAAKLREQLRAAGHDGVVVRKPSGEIYEMASFGDVPVKP